MCRIFTRTSTGGKGDVAVVMYDYAAPKGIFSGIHPGYAHKAANDYQSYKKALRAKYPDAQLMDVGAQLWVGAARHRGTTTGWVGNRCAYRRRQSRDEYPIDAEPSSQ